MSAEDFEGTPLAQSIRARCAEIGDCWLWSGAVNNRDVPAMRLTGSRKMHSVRRLILAGRGIKIGKRVAVAKCDHPLCVAPQHARAVTRKVLQERTTRLTAFQQRPARNAKLSAASRKRGVLTPEQVHETRTTSTPQAELAKRWGCTEDTVWRARNYKTYRDYSGPMAAMAGVLA